MRVLDLFSGIGGFSLGLERAGFETVAFCEIDPFCRQVLKKHWPEVPIHEDITKLDGTAYRGTVDVVCGGYPCQPFSTAGKRAGAEDDRHLWPEMFRIIKESRPTWVLCENVAGHIKLGLDSVLSDLESEGYTCQPLIIPACALDAPHRRDRVWIVAYSKSFRHREGREQRNVHKTNGRQVRQRCSIAGGASKQPQNMAKTDTNSNSKQRNRCRSPGREAGRDQPANLCEVVSNTQGQRRREAGEFRCNQSSQRPASSGKALADSDSDSGERLKPCQPDAQGRQEQGQRLAGSCGDGFRRWPAEPAVGRVANGVSFELDLIGGIEREQGDDQEAIAKTRKLVWKVLHYVWHNQELAKTSPELYRRGLRDFVPDMPHKDSSGGWLLGKRIKKDQGLCDLWEAFCAQSQQEAQDLQQKLLERIGQTKRPKEVGKRTDRIRALGNSVVPQIPEIIGRGIMEAHYAK